MIEFIPIIHVVVGVGSLIVRTIVPLIAMLDPAPDPPEVRSYAPHYHAVEQQQKPILEHFYVSDLDLVRPGIQPCPPCEQFDSDWHSDPQFREAILSKYEVYDYDAHERWPLAMSRGVTSWPSFYDVSTNRLIVGYKGKESLLAELGVEAGYPQFESPPRTIVENAPQPSDGSPTAEEIARAMDVLQRMQNPQPPADPPREESAAPDPESEGLLTRLIAMIAGALGLGAWIDSYRRLQRQKEKTEKLLKLLHRDKGSEQQEDKVGIFSSLLD